MKYTKKQRHEIYKKALNRFIEAPEQKAICPVIRNQSGSTAPWNVIVTEYNFPEFFYFRPDDISLNGHWFGAETIANSEHRKTVLEFCIEMTKP